MRMRSFSGAFARMFFLAAVSSAVLASAAGSALAVGLLPGDVYVAFDDDTGTSPGADPELSGTDLVDVTRDFERSEDGFDGEEVVEDLWNVDGTLRETVTRSDITSAMVFGSRIDVTDSLGPFGNAGLVSYALTGYAGWDVDIAWRSDLDPGFPFFVERSADGDKLNFTTGGELIHAGSGMFFSIKTNAQAYSLTGTAAITTYIEEFGDETIVFEGLAAPARVSAVPLPAGLPLLLASFGLLGWQGRKRACRPA